MWRSDSTRQNLLFVLMFILCMSLVTPLGAANATSANCSELLEVSSSDTQTGKQPSGIDNCSTTVGPNPVSTVESLIVVPNVKNQQSEIVKRFTYLDEMDRFCRGVGLINDVILALVQVEDFGCELWRIDPDGEHQLFADINSGQAGSKVNINFGSNPIFDGWYYFGADDGVNQYRLWRTDGVKLERIEEESPIPNGFEPYHLAWLLEAFDGRVYFESPMLNEQNQYRHYSTDGTTLRVEPQPPLPDGARVLSYHTLFDKMIVSIDGPWEPGSWDRQPWVFNGTEYRLLRELAPGSYGDIALDLWFYFDEALVFHAEVLKESGARETAFFYTDGEHVTQLPHDGRTYVSSYTALSGFISTRDYRYAVGTSQPGGIDGGIPVMRIGKHASFEYQLRSPPDDVHGGSVAILDDEAYVLANNRLFKLGETSAEEQKFDMPGNWEGSEYRFIGTDAFFYDAYIKETNAQGDSRVWVWNTEEVGLVKADGNHLVTHAEWFRHVDNDIYFYGEDEVNGWALRRIPDVAIKRLPPLAKITGAWFDPATSGQGFVLHPIDNNRTIFAFYGFEDDGSKMWLIGVTSSRLEFGKTISVEMMASSGGKFGSFDPGDIDTTLWGTLDIQFQTCSKATASLEGQSGQQSLSMVLLTQVEGIDCFYTRNPPKPETVGITGTWFDPATSGQGLLLHSMNDEQMLVSFYGFNNQTGRIWLIGEYNGQIDWNKPLEIEMTTATGGRFGGFSPDDVTVVSWGKLTIRFADCHNGIATLDGADGQQTMRLVKLAGLQGTGFDCPQN